MGDYDKNIEKNREKRAEVIRKMTDLFVNEVVPTMPLEVLLSCRRTHQESVRNMRSRASVLGIDIEDHPSFLEQKRLLKAMDARVEELTGVEENQEVAGVIADLFKKANS